MITPILAPLAREGDGAAGVETSPFFTFSAQKAEGKRLSEIPRRIVDKDLIFINYLKPKQKMTATSVHCF